MHLTTEVTKKDLRGKSPHGPTINLGWNLITEDPRKCGFLLWNLGVPLPPFSHSSDTETKPELCCNVFIMCQKNYTTAYSTHL